MDNFSLEDIQNGQVLLIDKPLDWTSFQAVNKLKYKIRSSFNIKKIKIGHAGTLDPKATGLLIVCTGKATKKISEIQDAPKEYLAKVKIGAQTPCFDTEMDEILPKDISHISEEAIKNCIATFVGEIDQTPPLFSALKHEGKRMYDLARAGKEIEIKSRKTTIYSISNIQINLPFIDFTVACSKGTYIRSLAHDIGQKLEVGGYLAALRRTKIGEFSVENASNHYFIKDN